MKRKSLLNIVVSLTLAASMVFSTASIGFAEETPDAGAGTQVESGQDNDQTGGTQSGDDQSGSDQNGQEGQNGEDQSGNTGGTDNPGTEGSNGQEGQDGQGDQGVTNPSGDEQDNPEIIMGYKLTITGQDEEGFDILEGTYDGEPIKDAYILVARIYDMSLMDEEVPNGETNPGELGDEDMDDITDPEPPTVRPHEYLALDPTADNSAYEEKMIYHFDEEGVGSIYTGNDVITLIYGDKGVTLNTKDGEVAAPAEPGTLKVSGGFLWEIDENGIATKHIVDPDKSGTYYKTVDGLLYTVRYDTAAATALSAIYKGKVYRQGAILKRAGYIVYNKYIYKVTATGTATKFLKNKKAKLSKKYFYICETPYGNKYLFSIRYRTGYAVAYVKDKTKTSTYGYYTANTKYWVVYNTGRILQSKGDSEPRQVLVDNAVKYMGYCESAVGGPSHMGIVSIYNKHKPLPRNYTMKFRDAWCATYVSAMFIETGMISIFPKECSCAYQVAKWKKLGRWTENDAYVPKKGDIIYYDWQDSGKGNNKGKPDHVGIVLEVNNGKITVIEGNYNDRVQKRVIKVNGRYIRGYGLPWYAKAVK